MLICRGLLGGSAQELPLRTVGGAGGALGGPGQADPSIRLGDEWLAVRRYFSLGSMAVLYGSSPEELEVLPLGVPREVIAVQLVTTDEEPNLHHLTGRDPGSCG